MNEEARTFAAKLVARTNEGKLTWKETADQNSFICTLEDVIFEVNYDGDLDVYALEMRDDEGTTVFRASAVEPSSRTSAENDRFYELVTSLYEKARRIALNLEEKVKKASVLLDKL